MERIPAIYVKRKFRNNFGNKFFGNVEVGLHGLYPQYRVEVARIVGVMQGNLKYEGMPMREEMVCLRVENMKGDKYNFDYDHNTAGLVACALNVSDVKKLVGEQIYLCYNSNSQTLEGFYKPQGSARTIW